MGPCSRRRPRPSAMPPPRDASAVSANVIETFMLAAHSPAPIPGTGGVLSCASSGVSVCLVY